MKTEPFPRRRFAAGSAAFAAPLLIPPWRTPVPVGAMDHGLAAGRLADRGRDPMIAADPQTGAVYGARVQAIDAAAATPVAETAADRVRLTRSEEGGASFGPPMVASGDDGVISCVGSSPLVVDDPAGGVLVAYQRNASREGVDFGRDILRVARSADGGRTFAPAADVFADADAVEAGTFHDALATSDGAPYVAWLSHRTYTPQNGTSGDPSTRVRIARSDDGGSTFGPSDLVDGTCCECCRVAFSLAADGTLYLAWRDREEQPDGGDPIRNMVVSRSTDRGESWDEPSLVHDDAWQVGQCPEPGPALAVDRQGRLRVAWFSGKESGPGVSYASSGDGGRTFTPPAALVSADYFPHANVRAALDEAGGFWVTRDDDRTDEGSIGVVRVDLDDALEPDAAPSSGRTPDIAVGTDGRILTRSAAEPVDVAPLADLEQGS